jgi:hypothetical protein
MCTKTDEIKKHLDTVQSIRLMNEIDHMEGPDPSPLVLADRIDEMGEAIEYLLTHMLACELKEVP